MQNGGLEEAGQRVGSNASLSHHRRLLRRIIDAYDEVLIRAYSKVRFSIININILDILALCLRGRRRILDVGCGFGLFGCYFASLFPGITYSGYDVDAHRVEMACRAANRLGLTNARFHCRDARELSLHDEFDAVLMIDLLHHLSDEAKQELLEECTRHLSAEGRLVIKEVTTHPFPELAFTWALDVLMTRGFDMWYWNEEKFTTVLSRHFHCVETYPISDWMPYPHVVYLCEDRVLS